MIEWKLSRGHGDLLTRRFFLPPNETVARFGTDHANCLKQLSTVAMQDYGFPIRDRKIG